MSMLPGLFTIKGLPSVTLHFSLYWDLWRKHIPGGKHLMCKMSLLLTKWFSVWGGDRKYKKNCSFHQRTHLLELKSKVQSIAEGTWNSSRRSSHLLKIHPQEVLSNMNKKLWGKRDKFSIFVETPKKLKQIEYKSFESQAFTRNHEISWDSKAKDLAVIHQREKNTMWGFKKPTMKHVRWNKTIH